MSRGHGAVQHAVIEYLQRHQHIPEPFAWHANSVLTTARVGLSGSTRAARESTRRAIGCLCDEGLVETERSASTLNAIYFRNTTGVDARPRPRSDVRVHGNELVARLAVTEARLGNYLWRAVRAEESGRWAIFVDSLIPGTVSRRFALEALLAVMDRERFELLIDRGTFRSDFVRVDSTTWRMSRSDHWLRPRHDI